jgi:hypothetical protein
MREIRYIYNWRILMNSERFDLITQELLKHQQTMELLQAENRELRQQLADLRTGRGIFIEINGLRFALNATILAQDSIQSFSVKTSSSVQLQASPSIGDKPAAEMSQLKLAEDVKKAMPMPNDQEEKANSRSTFLEEAMMSEFDSALGSPMALLQDPIKGQEKSGEEQKANLRRELMGSYLLD